MNVHLHYSRFEPACSFLWQLQFLLHHPSSFTYSYQGYVGLEPFSATIGYKPGYILGRLPVLWGLMTSNMTLHTASHLGEGHSQKRLLISIVSNSSFKKGFNENILPKNIPSFIERESCCQLSTINLMSVKARAYGLHHFHTHQTTRWPFMPCEWDSGKQVPSASRRFIKRWSRVITLKNFPFVISAPPSKRTS